MNKNTRDWSAYQLLIIVIVLSATVFFSLSANSTEPALAYSKNSAELQWGPCPPFFQAGCQIAVLHGSPERPNVDVFFKVPGQSDLPNHWHSSAERMVLVSGKLAVKYKGRDSVILTPGMYAYGPAKAEHDGRCLSSEPCVLFIAFEQPLDAMEVASPAD